jgi:dephospho-CoA kinase
VKDLGEVVTMGDVIRKETKKRGLDPTDKNLGETARDLRKKGGSIAIAKKCVDLIKELEVDIVFIDGIRSYDEVELFKAQWNFSYIAILTDENIRFTRIKTRGRNDDPQSKKELQKRDAREIQFGLKKAIKNANHRVFNNSSEDDLKKKVRKIVEKIISE